MNKKLFLSLGILVIILTTMQIADTLLNNPHPIGIEYNYLFMPGDPNAYYGSRPGN